MVLENKESSTKDSSFVEAIQEKDTVISLPGEVNTTTIPCDLDTTYTINTNLGLVIVTVKDKKVISTTVIKERLLAIEKTKTTKNTVVNTVKDSIVYKTNIKEVPVKVRESYIPKFVLYSAIILWICTFVLLVRGIVKWYIKRKLKL